jgi:hypothetical protein
MYIVNTYIGPSAIHGVGVFAGEDIARGAVVSRHMEGFDAVYDVDFLDRAQLPLEVHDFVEHHAYINKGRMWMPGDLDMFTNHSFTPNVGYNDTDGSFYALRDISKGEEITNDYREFSEWARANMVTAEYA